MDLKLYRSPTMIDPTGHLLVGAQVQIYWDGDDAFYSGRILSYDPERMTHLILYFDGIKQEENLSKTPWKIFDPSMYETKPGRSMHAEDMRNRRAKAARLEQENNLEKLKKSRDFYLSSHLSVLKPFIKKSPYYDILKKTESFLPLGDPHFDIGDINSGLIPICVPGLENLQKLVLGGIISAEVASFVCLNPSAVTLGGTYVSRSVLPPLHVSHVQGSEAPSLLSKDASCIGHTIVLDEHTGSYQTMLLDPVENRLNFIEHKTFAGYVIAWPGRRLSSAVSIDHSDALAEMVENGSVDVDISHVYFLEKKVVGNNVGETKTLRLTALRLNSGDFIALSKDILPFTMGYAHYSSVPVSNLISFSYMCPHDNTVKSVVRLYCDPRYYQTVFERVLRRAGKSIIESDEVGRFSVETFMPIKYILRSREQIARDVSSVSLPSEVVRQPALREFHIKAAKWMLHMYNKSAPMILRDTSGEGKELEVAAFAASVFKSSGDAKSRHTILIVCPFLAILKWQEALNIFSPLSRYISLCGSRIERIKQKKNWAAKNASCLLTTFRCIEDDRQFFEKCSLWSCVVVDRAAEVFDQNRFEIENKLLPASKCKVLLPPRHSAPETDCGFRLWSELNFVAPDIFDQTSLRSIQGGFLNSEFTTRLPPLVYSSSEVDMSANFEIIDISIVAPLTRAQLQKYLPAISKINDCNDVMARKQLRDICNYVPLSNHGNVWSENGSRLENESPSACVAALLQGSSKLFLLHHMLPSLRDDGRTVLIICYSEEFLLAIEDYCVLKEFPILRLGGSDSVARNMDIEYMISSAVDVFVYTILIEDAHIVEAPAVDTVILCDAAVDAVDQPSSIDHIVNSIRICNPLVIYRLFSSSTSGDIVKDVFPVLAISETSDQSTGYEVLCTEKGLCASDVRILMSVRELKEKDITLSENNTMNVVVAGPWVQPSIHHDRKVAWRSQSICIRGTRKPLYSDSPSLDTVANGVKSWVNLKFCCLCGCCDLPDQEQRSTATKYHNHKLINCKLCPKSFHRKCFEESALPQKELVLEECVCPQHLCACGANVGIMCPCVHCLTVYCEKCLPSNTVESLGRRTVMTSECNFFCRTYHYILCDFCSQIENAELLCDSERLYIDSANQLRAWKSSDLSQAAGNSARQNLIILPSQMTACHNEEIEASKKRKRNASNVSISPYDDPSDNEKSVGGSIDDMSVDPNDGSVAFYVRITIDGAEICQPKKLTAEADSTLTFSDVLRSIDTDLVANYSDSYQYEMTVSAYLSKACSNDTKIDCSPNDEVVGAIFLGYTFICFEGKCVKKKK